MQALDDPTDAAGAWTSRAAADVAARLNLDPRDFLRRNDAYTFFDLCGGLLRTGPTHTNVMDVRVAASVLAGAQRPQRGAKGSERC